MIDLTYWLLAILMLGIIVTLHEVGHFWAARATGVSVVEFAVGFGPKLWSRKAKSGVTYSIRLLPLGGYCRFVADDEENEAEGMFAFYKQKIWKRALISLSGPLMNFFTAIVLLFLLFFIVGIAVGVEPTISKVTPGLPAEQAGVAAGDQIVSVNGIDIMTIDEVSALISGAAQETIDLGVERNGETLRLKVQPQWVEAENRYMIGIEYGATNQTTVRLGFGDSLSNALSATGRMCLTIVDVLRDLIFRGQGVEDLSGPIGTVVAIKEQTEAGGLFSYLYLASVISVNLGLFNLLPTPGLDGSKLIFYAIEKIRGKRLDPNKEGAVLLVGFALMIVVMVLAMYQDISRLIQ